ncbi:MAG: glycosyltransferase [Phycisphaerales bacterium]|nr:glycosyltransferase [Phycisphaerales bacterium]MCI0629369.1 glycosyltransferase [Phycisphaerales bacterium]MCI0676846.1 glycosyltransferase [Phycisphaerales bacterium]
MPLNNLPRVGYVLKVYPRLCETFILGEILAHEAAGLEIEIFSLRPTSDSRFHEGLSRVRAPVTYVPSQSIKSQDLWEALCRARFNFDDADALMDEAACTSGETVYQAILLAEAIRARGINHVHAHFGTLATTVARLASRLAGIPYSFTAHAKDIFHESVDQDDLRRKLCDAHAVVAVSEYNLSYLRSVFGESGSSVRRIYNGVDLQEFPWSKPVNRSPLVLGVGRLVEKKGFSDLIDACAILARQRWDFTCQIIGEGLLRDALQEQIERLDLGDRVHLSGPQPRHEVKNLMQRAAVIVAPCVLGSDGNRDSLPTVILEAMALGTPCISTDVGGIPEMIRDRDTGLIVPQRDPQMLAEAIQQLLANEPLRVELATSARHLAELEFDIHQNTRTMREIFQPGGARATQVAVEVA